MSFSSQWTRSSPNEQLVSSSKTGLGLFVGIREDGFHRAWRDFQLAMSHSKGKLVHTAVQLNLAFNVNHGPFGQGAHMAKRCEFQLEWHRLMPAFGEDFEALVGNIALDSGLPPPRSVAELQSWYNDLVLGNETYEKKEGAFMKQCSWFSILKLISMHDKVWHARKWQAEQVASLVKGEHGKDFVTKFVADTTDLGKSSSSATPTQENTKDTHLAELQQLRKKAGNAMLLAPHLMNANNLVNARIMLLVGQAVWSEQTLWSVSKTTAAANKDLVVRVACGLGECMVKQMWKNTTHQPEQLSRLGIEALKGQPFLNISPSSGNIEARLMSFLLHLMEEIW